MVCRHPWERPTCTLAWYAAGHSVGQPDRSSSGAQTPVSPRLYGSFPAFAAWGCSQHIEKFCIHSVVGDAAVTGRTADHEQEQLRKVNSHLILVSTGDCKVYSIQLKEASRTLQPMSRC